MGTNKGDNVDILQRTISQLSDSDPSYSDILNELGDALKRRFEQGGRIDDLNQAIAVKQRAIGLATVKLTPASHHALLGSLLHTRSERLGDLGDLEGAISYQSQAIALASTDPERALYLDSFGSSLHSRHERLGSMEDLHNAISPFLLMRTILCILTIWPTRFKLAFGDKMI
jgi:tetratricopeptide (TPR) repeat protein